MAIKLRAKLQEKMQCNSALLVLKLMGSALRFIGNISPISSLGA